MNTCQAFKDLSLLISLSKGNHGVAILINSAYLVLAILASPIRKNELYPLENMSNHQNSRLNG
jgi:hypothetical protein